jgi:riboflavin kinase/FMN adenylyltransferase
MARAPLVFRSLEEASGHFGPCALSIGNFDGLHVGHRQILRRVVALARARGWKASALTFNPHPARVVAPQRVPRLLTTPEQRAELMAAEGIEQVLILPFTQQVAHLRAEEFARDVLVQRLGVRAVLVGANFRFGYRHAGDTKRLEELGREYGFATEVVPAVRLRGHPISSSEIRRLIESGDVARAARLLARPHRLEGEVVPGHGIGSAQTVPTLNLRTACEVLPACGVYITRTQEPGGGRSWTSVTNVGFRPTFEGSSLSVETYLLDGLAGDAPPRRIGVEFLRRLRGERRFAGAESLKAQILKDVERARRYFRRVGRYTRKEPQVHQ